MGGVEGKKRRKGESAIGRFRFKLLQIPMSGYSHLLHKIS